MALTAFVGSGLWWSWLGGDVVVSGASGVCGIASLVVMAWQKRHCGWGLEMSPSSACASTFIVVLLMMRAVVLMHFQGLLGATDAVDAVMVSNGR